VTTTPAIATGSLHFNFRAGRDHTISSSVVLETSERTATGARENIYARPRYKHPSITRAFLILSLDIHSFGSYFREHPLRHPYFRYKPKISAAIRSSLRCFRFAQTCSMVWWVMCFWNVVEWGLLWKTERCKEGIYVCDHSPATMICYGCIFSRIYVPRASGQRHSSIARPFKYAARQRRYNLRGLYFPMRPEWNHSLLFERFWEAGESACSIAKDRRWKGEKWLYAWIRFLRHAWTPLHSLEYTSLVPLARDTHPYAANLVRRAATQTFGAAFLLLGSRWTQPWRCAVCTFGRWESSREETERRTWAIK